MSSATFFDPTDASRMLLPQRSLSLAPRSSCLIDLDNIELLSATVDRSMIIASRKVLSNNEQVFQTKEILETIYKYCNFVDQTLHTRVSKSFNAALKNVDLSVFAAGEHAEKFCRMLERLEFGMTILVRLSLGDDAFQLRQPQVTALRGAFDNDFFPNLRSFHVAVHTDMAEQNLTDLFTTMSTSSLKLLEEFDVSGCYMGTSCTRALAPLLASWPTLTTFNVSKNGTSSVGSLALFKSILTTNPLPSLTSLNISRNTVKSGFRTFPKTYTKVLKKTLLVLDLSNNGINDEDVIIGCNEVFKSSSGGDEEVHALRELDASFNPLADAGACRLLTTLFSSQVNNLVKLNLSGVDATHRLGTTVGSLIAGGNLTSLEYLDVSCNSLNRPGIEKLVDGLKTRLCSKLRHLDLRNCSLGDSGVQLLSNGMRDNALIGLKYLNIGANNCFKSLVHLSQIMKENVDKFVGLRVLDVSKNIPPGDRGVGCPRCFRDKIFKEEIGVEIVFL
jgi:Ran GTPase-activating protein (RanGAP) involved in mRNA processing and transport